MMIKRWQQFNEELKTWTYRDAAYKLQRMGHKDRSKRLFSHAEDMIVRNSEKYGIGEVEFQNGVKAKFAGFDFGMSWDTYLDNDYQHLTIPLFFQFPEEWDGDTIFCPISFEYNIDEDKLELYAYGEEAMEDLYGVKILKFKHRKDVMKIISVLKNLDLKSEFTWDYSEEEFERYQSDYRKLISKLKVNELYV
jgi:hypothetical protein